MAHPIPQVALAHHIAFLGKTGSGKSNGAKVIAEEALETGERVCIVDPTGSWWGLRLKANGKPSNYPVVIFGGLHADVAIDRAHGAAVAEVIATSSTPAVIDTRLMTVGERTQFFTDFAETLLRKNTGPLRLILDEAHVFAPQGRVADPNSGKMLHAANNLVSLGRSIGLRIVMISQRPAKLHKDSLTQIETLVAMRLIAPQDRAAVEDWIGEWADKQQGREIIQSLPSLPTGDAWVWSPEAGFLQRVHFPLARTYDSGKAPVAGEAGPELKQLDLATVNALLDKAAAELKANDPRHLKAEVARLQRELAAAAKGTPDRQDVIDSLEGERDDLQAEVEKLTTERDHFKTGYEEYRRRNEAALKALGVSRLADLDEEEWANSLRQVEIRPSVPAKIGRLPPREAPIRIKSVPDGNGSVTGPQQRILDAIAWWEAFGIQRPTNEQVAFMSGYAPSSGGYKNPKSAARVAGLIEYPAPGLISLTEAGRAQANAPDAPTTREELHRRVNERLSGPQRAILAPLLAAWPDQMANDDLAAAAGYAPSSGGYKNPKSSLRTLTVVDYPSPGQIRAADWLFP